MHGHPARRSPQLLQTASPWPFLDTRVHASGSWVPFGRMDPGKRSKPMSIRATGQGVLSSGVHAARGPWQVLLVQGGNIHLALWTHLFLWWAVAAEGPRTGSSKTDSPGLRLQLSRAMVVLYLTPPLRPGLCLFLTSGRCPTFLSLICSMSWFETISFIPKCSLTLL